MNQYQIFARIYSLETIGSMNNWNKYALLCWYIYTNLGVEYKFYTVSQYYDLHAKGVE